MTDGTGSGSTSRPSQFGGNVPRRLSYASVASGATSQSIHHPTRSGAFSQLGTSTPSSTYPPQYQADHQYQRRYSEQDQDSLGAAYWRKPAPLPSYSRKFANIPTLGTGAMPPNPFFIPSYLRHSRYMAKLEAAHKAKLKRDREQPSSASASLNSYSSSPSTARLAPSHRGMTYDIIESNPPREEDILPPLPCKWSEQDKYPGLDIMSDGQDLKYSGSASKAEIEAASVRTEHPMPLRCGIYYFEVEIKQKGKETAIAVGFSTSEASLERLPGWETHSWGYHGDDGKMFFGEHSGRIYGPTFGAGDVIGCGINFNTCQAFFTKNGQDLGVCFRELKKEMKLYPTIGMKKHSGALLTGNFGQRPFVFDIDDKMLSEKANVSKDISKAKVTSRGQKDENSLIQELVAHFLAHDGYVETAKAFADEMRREKKSLSNAQPANTPPPSVRDDADAVHRQRIRRAILSGDIDQALEITHTHFPTVLVENPDIVFRLKCRKWIELISKSTELSTRKSSRRDRRSSNGVDKASNLDDDFTQDMELDIDSHANGVGKSPANESGLQHDQLLQEVMLYGQELHREFQNEEGDNAKALQDIFSLVAYNDPKQSVHGNLLDPSGRATVAEELNSAILVSLGRSPSAALETAWKQSEALIDMLSDDGGPAAFVNLQATFSN